uniref:Ribosomal protein S10 n=1 Tax=Ficedula albicollis TaxID=59894 RepID=A0A803VK04_FICAL
MPCAKCPACLGGSGAVSPSRFSPLLSLPGGSNPQQGGRAPGWGDTGCAQGDTAPVPPPGTRARGSPGSRRVFWGAERCGASGSLERLAWDGTPGRALQPRSRGHRAPRRAAGDTAGDMWGCHGYGVTMLMPKKNRIAIYELLFKEGVMVAKKDVHMPKHPELVDKNVPNLHVMKAMQSLKSRGYVKEQFAWRHFYWYLTNEGIQYLRDYLHLPPEIVPATLRRSRPETGRPRPKGLEGERPARLTRGEADRDTYRRSAVPPGADKKAEAGAGAATEFQFRGGFGRGRGQPPQ